MRYLSDDDLKRTRPAESSHACARRYRRRSSRTASSRRCPRRADQRSVERGMRRLAEELAPRHGMTRRQFLASNAGMAAAFVAMNEVFGPLFDVSRAEAATPGVADAPCRRARRPVHLRLPDALRARGLRRRRALLGLAQFAKQHWNPGARERERPDSLHVRELREGDLRRQRHQGRVAVGCAGRRSLQPVPDQRPDRRGAHGRQRHRGLAAHARAFDHPADDAGLSRRGGPLRSRRCIPTAGRATRSAIRSSSRRRAPTGGSTTRSSSIRSTRRPSSPVSRTVCIHKGLMPADYEQSWPGIWKHATVWDLGKAARTGRRSRS